MYLFIQSATPDDSRVMLLTARGLATKRVPFRNGVRGDILSCVDSLLRSKKVQLRSLKGLCVITGPGHFSYLRTGISIANTIGWALSIPVVGVQTTEFDSYEDLLEKGKKLLARKKKFTPIMPAYGREPTITKPTDLMEKGQ